jgi:hypothetical protein
MTAKRWFIAVVQALLIAWMLLYIAGYFDLRFPAEAGGMSSTAQVSAQTCLPPAEPLIKGINSSTNREGKP